MLEKHSVSIRGHRTSYSLEPAFHAELEHIARQQGIPLARLITQVDAERQDGTNLSSALRLMILEHLKAAADELD